MKTKNNKKRKGFTLIELIVVIAILAILAAVAIPQFFSLIDRANQATLVANAAEVANAINVYNATAPTDITSTSGWTELDTHLGNLAPRLDPAVKIADVLKKVGFGTGGIAYVNKTIG